MTTPIEDLGRDHRNMERLLALIEDQVDRFREGTPLDFDLLASVLDYIRNFPERCHHPREDLVFQRLLTRHPSATEAIGDLLKEHRQLAELTARLVEAVRYVELEMDVPRARLESVARDYIAACRRHIAEEERVFFPLAEQRLTDEDWREIEAAISAPDDPLFGPRVEKHYLNLHERILRLGV